MTPEGRVNAARDLSSGVDTCFTHQNQIDRQPELSYVSSCYIKSRSSAGSTIPVSTDLVQGIWRFTLCDARLVADNCELVVSILFQAEYRRTGSLLTPPSGSCLGRTSARASYWTEQAQEWSRKGLTCKVEI